MKKISSSAIGEEERQLFTVPYRIHPASKLFIVLLAAGCSGDVAFALHRFMSRVAPEYRLPPAWRPVWLPPEFFFCLTIGHVISWISAMPLLTLNTFSIGMVTPNLVHGTMEPVPEIAGVASSLFGSARMIAGAISAEPVALWYNTTPVAMAGAMLLFATAALGCWLFSLRFFPEALEAVPRRRAENVFAEH